MTLFVDTKESENGWSFIGANNKSNLIGLSIQHFFAAQIFIGDRKRGGDEKKKSRAVFCDLLNFNVKANLCNGKQGTAL